ncbi:MAG: PLP-dependent aminotransferase family protein [Paracoccaceae bacterium]
MDTKSLLDPKLAPGPRFRALADRICAAVEDGALAPGVKLPPVRDLAYRLGIGPGAVARAYRLGIERGVLEATVWRGTFVRTTLAERPGPRFAADGLFDDLGRDAIDLRGNRAVEVGQDVEIGRALTRLLARWDHRPPLAGYRRREQDPEAIESMAGWLRSFGVPAEAERLLVTVGAQAGVVAAMTTLVRGGSGVVLTAATLHAGLKDGAAARGVRLEPVASDGEGLMPEALDAACARLKPDAVQLSATLHNPTLETMGPGRRHAIAAVARAHDIAVVEDDVYGALMDPAPESFAAIAPERTWYVASFSKCVAAGVRAGLLLTPPGRTTAALRSYQALAHQTPWLVKALAAEMVDGGEAAVVRERVLGETRARAAEAARLLGPYGARTHPAASFVHLPLCAPWEPGEFVAAAAAARVLLPPATTKRVGRPRGSSGRSARAAAVPREALSEALVRLARLLAEGPRTPTLAT